MEKVRIPAYFLLVMVGLGGLEPPTSPLSVLKSFVSRSFLESEEVHEGELAVDIAMSDSYHREYEG